MKYLKPEILYPEFFDKIENLDLIKKAHKDYDEYFNSIKNQLPKQLVKIFSEKYAGFPDNRFHDCVIKELSTLGYSKYYKNASDIIKLTLELGREIEYRIKFLDINEIKVSTQNNQGHKCFLGEILICELGITDESYYTFAAYTSSETEIYLEFKKIIISKLKKF